MDKTNLLENKKVVYSTLGCKLNFTETSHIAGMLGDLGMHTVSEGEEADYCIINTCSVTALADKKCRQLIRHLHREHPKAKIIVIGCYAQLNPCEISMIEGVDLVVGASEKSQLASYIEQLESGETLGLSMTHSPVQRAVHFLPSVSSEGRTRHFLKVQDGCDYKCSYCTIPMARGKSRNGSISELVTLAQQVAAEGGKEIVLTGVNVGDFGRSTGETFIDLIQALDQVEGIDRFRISSIEPNLITHDIIDFVATSKRFAPHFHIPLQSGSNEVLKLMRRRYNKELFREKVLHINRVLPNAYIGVDVIVGMRGELPEFFEESFDLLNELNVSKLHVFPYSERANTDALKIEYIVSPNEKQERSHRLLKLSDNKLRAFNENQIGTIHKALIEHSNDTEWVYGFTENYVRVRLPYKEHLQGEVVDVSIGSFLDGDTGLMNASLVNI